MRGAGGRSGDCGQGKLDRHGYIKEAGIALIQTRLPPPDKHGIRNKLRRDDTHSTQENASHWKKLHPRRTTFEGREYASGETGIDTDYPIGASRDKLSFLSKDHRGRRIRKVTPRSGLLLKSSVPPWFSTMLLATARPRPKWPLEWLRDLSAR